MKKGFTLIELMIVIAIIMMLAAIIIPNVINYTNRGNGSNDIVIIDKSQYNEKTLDKSDDMTDNKVSTDKWGDTESRY
jgi:prepilin-type N-terminal cleavage/methylation domain-containing protein